MDAAQVVILTHYGGAVDEGAAEIGMVRSGREPDLARVQPASPRRDKPCPWACRPFSPIGRLSLAPHKQAILLRRVRNLHLDPLRDELLRMMDARYALIEILERFERTLLAFLQDGPHRLLAEAGQQFEHVEPRSDRLRAVEEVDELRLLLLHRLLDDERQFLLCGGRELLVSDAALHVEHFLAHVDIFADVDPLPDRQGYPLFRHELEEFELVYAERVR